jgi:hypothetical protein
LRNDAHFRNALLGRAGRTVTAETTTPTSLLRLSARWAPDDDGQFKRLVVEKTHPGFCSRIETAPLTTGSRLGSGTIRSSLFAATDESNIPDAVAVQMAEIFSGDIDFPPRPAQGRPLQRGLRNAGSRWRAPAHRPRAVGRVREQRQDPPGHVVPGARQQGRLLHLDGQSLRRAYLASPMEFSRVTSGFKMRFHPILQKWRAHLGTDYAAPTGTPCAPWVTAWSSLPACKTALAMWCLCKHRNNTPPSTPT